MQSNPDGGLLLSTLLKQLLRDPVRNLPMPGDTLGDGRLDRSCIVPGPRRVTRTRPAGRRVYTRRPAASPGVSSRNPADGAGIDRVGLFTVDSLLYCVEITHR
jgi:hypothetical protein